MLTYTDYINLDGGSMSSIEYTVITEFEKIKFKLRYSPKTRNVKQPVDKCAYGENNCYYGKLKLNSPKCPFKHKCNCPKYNSYRCLNWQLLVNKRFRNSKIGE